MGGATKHSTFSIAALATICRKILFLTAVCTAAASAQNKPNVIVIMSDDQGWGDLSFNGNRNLQTPNIDLLSRSGASFGHFYVSPVCSPTRAELLTGRYHTRGGVYSTSSGGERLNLDETTIADVFKKNGYATAAFGKWHNGMQYPYHPNARGFDEFYGFCSGHWGNYFDPVLEHNGKVVQGKGYITDLLTDRAIEYMDAHRKSPFFLYLPFNAPHSPMQVPDRWWNKFRHTPIEMRADDQYPEDTNFTKAALAMCENLDWNIGRVLNKLKDLDLENETIVVYLHDNGPNSFRWNNGLKGRKGSTDEGGIRSPLIIKWPGKINNGLKIPEISSVIDLFPTLTELAGIRQSPIKPLDGISLKPLLMEKKSKQWNDRILFSHWNNRTSARTQKYRLDHEGNLYDIEKDPGQQTNITDQNKEIAKYLSDQIRQWKENIVKTPPQDLRKFSVGHPEFRYTHLPARDAIPHGNIQRSNKFPNSSFFSNWTGALDKITWDIEVLSDGLYEAEIYYSCPVGDLGSMVRLTFGQYQITHRLTVANDVPLTGMENDRVTRQESYFQAFKPLKLGTIRLKKGLGLLVLDAPEIAGKKVMDFQQLVLTRRH